MNRPFLLRIDEWLAAPIEGHGLYARYADARDLLTDLRAVLEAMADETIRAAIDEAMGGTCATCRGRGAIYMQGNYIADCDACERIAP